LTILIAGGAGFIGSHLTEAILKKGKDVLVIDNLYTGSLQNIEIFKTSKKFDFIEWDVIDKFKTNRKIDGIINLASPASPIHYQRDPIFTLKSNTIGVINLLELALEKNCRILQASTSEVYGDPLESPQRESYLGNVNPLSTRACYDEGKRVAETFFKDFNRHHKLDTRIVRIFNTYGPKMQINDGRVVTNFIVQAIKNLPITIYGNGSQTRSFCYVSDLINALVEIFFAQDTVAGPINIGNPEEISIKKLLEVILKKTGSQSELEFHPFPDSDPMQRKPDISLAKSILKWSPTVNLSAGLDLTIADIKPRIN